VIMFIPEYPKALGRLQGNVIALAEMIEIVSENIKFDDWAKIELETIARKLRAAEQEAESMCSPEINEEQS